MRAVFSQARLWRKGEGEIHDGLALFKVQQILIPLRQRSLLPSMRDHPADPSFSGNVGSVRKANAVLVYGNMPEPWGVTELPLGEARWEQAS